MSNMLNWPSHLKIQLLPPVSVINTLQKYDHKPLPWSRVTGKKPGKKLLEVVFVVWTMFWPLCTLFCYLLPREASIAYSCHMWVGLHNSLTHSLAAPTPDLPNFREQNNQSTWNNQPRMVTLQPNFNLHQKRLASFSTAKGTQITLIERFEQCSESSGLHVANTKRW